MRTAGNSPTFPVCQYSEKGKAWRQGRNRPGRLLFAPSQQSKRREWKEWATDGASESAREMAQSEAAPPARGSGEAEAS